MEIVCNTNDIKLIKKISEIEQKHIEKLNSLKKPEEKENPICFLCKKELSNKKRERFTVVKDYQLYKLVCLICYKDIRKNTSSKS